jgi:hypothetical protein
VERGTVREDTGYAVPGAPPSQAQMQAEENFPVHIAAHGDLLHSLGQSVRARYQSRDAAARPVEETVVCSTDKMF